jgi:hypothetical protein
VIDAAGAIYVIGGSRSGTYYNDVYASTDGGARPDYVGAGGRGYCVGTQGRTRGIMGY